MYLNDFVVDRGIMFVFEENPLAQRQAICRVAGFWDLDAAWRLQPVELQRARPRVFLPGRGVVQWDHFEK